MEDKYHLLILKSLIEGLTEDENKELSLWLNSDIKNQTRFEETKRAWHRSTSMPFDFNPDTKDAWGKVKSKLNITEKESSRTSFKNINSNNISLFGKNYLSIVWKAAAVILVVIGIRFIALEVAEKSSNDPSNLSQIYSATAEKSFIQLIDGTKVWLNKNTTLSCMADFNQQTRTVQMTGEAFFEVAKNADKPFIILSGATRTTVLGTAFNLRAYKNESNTELVVVHGKVSFANNNTEGLILEKDDKGVINNKTGEARKLVNENINFMAWKDEKLFFNKAKFEDVRKDIESYFSIKIEVESPAISKCYFTGTFEKPKLEDVLNVIQVTMNINHKKEKDKIVLSGTGCN